MKKTLVLIGLVAVFALLLIPAGVALADNGPHGGYTGTNTPDGCAGCHRAHTAQGAMLLKSSTITALCTSCHGTAAPGAQTNVMDGVYAEGVNDPGGQGVGGGGLHGGGFVNTVMNTSFNPTAPGSSATKSRHTIDGLSLMPGETAVGTIWGIGAIGSGPGTSHTLECTDCHNPHGNSGPNGEPTYRILRSTVMVPGAAAGAIVEDEATKNYTIDGAPGNEGIPNNYFQEAYTAANGAPVNPDQGTATWNTGSRLSVFCATCHTRYLAPTGAYETSSGDPIYKYRHPAGSTAHGNVNCVTCHVSHGSSAAAIGFAATVPQPGTAEGGGTYDGSALLRLDNRGTCANCHAAEWVRGKVTSMTPATLAASDTTTLVTIAGSGLTNFNRAGTELVGGFIKLTKTGSPTAYGVIGTWSNTSVTFRLPSGMTAGAWTILVIPNGTRDSNRRTPVWPSGAGQGTLTLN